MPGNSSIFNSKKYPSGFFVFCILIVIFEWGNIAFDDYLVNMSVKGPFGKQMVTWKNDLILSEKLNYDILIFGDSYNHMGIVPEILDKETHLSSYNFSAFADMTVYSSLCLLKAYLKRHPPPKYIVIGFNTDTLNRLSDEAIEDDIGNLYCFSKGNILFFMKEFGWEQGIKCNIPSLKHQSVIRKFIANPASVRLPNKDEVMRAKTAFMRSKGYYGRLENLSYDKNKIPGFLFAGKLGALDTYLDQHQENYNYAVTERSFGYLKEFLRAADAKNIQVIYNIPTQSPDIEIIGNYYGKIDFYKKFFMDLLTDFQKIKIIDPRQVLNDPKFFSDERHLNLTGRRVLTQYVAKTINDSK